MEEHPAYDCRRNEQEPKDPVAPEAPRLFGSAFLFGYLLVVWLDAGFYHGRALGIQSAAGRLCTKPQYRGTLSSLISTFLV